MDGLDYDGIDPVQYVPESYKECVLTVSSVIQRSDLLRKVLRYFNCYIYPFFLKAM